jgi:hypothetical protein
MRDNYVSPSLMAGLLCLSFTDGGTIMSSFNDGGLLCLSLTDGGDVVLQ